MIDFIFMTLSRSQELTNGLVHHCDLPHFHDFGKGGKAWQQHKYVSGVKSSSSVMSVVALHMGILSALGVLLLYE